ncbi:Vesicle transport protein SEC20, partial [Cryptotermes secundus]
FQDINTCPGPLEVLNELNREGRSKIGTLRSKINQLEILAKEEVKETERTKLLKEVESHRDQLASTVGAFRKANIMCMLAIQKSNKEELLDQGSEEAVLRHRVYFFILLLVISFTNKHYFIPMPKYRQRKDKEGLVKMSSDVTEQLLSISRHLAETTQRSAGSLETLANSSSNVQGTQEELKTTGSVILQSRKLLAKYGRREFTDKVLLIFAFVFFLACVLYILQKRFF